MFVAGAQVYYPNLEYLLAQIGKQGSGLDVFGKGQGRKVAGYQNQQQDGQGSRSGSFGCYGAGDKA